MLQITSGPSNICFFSTKANESQHNQEVKGGGGIGEIIKTLSKAKKSKK